AFAAFMAPEHPDAGENEESAEQEQDRLELHHQRHADADQQRTQHHDADNAPEQHPMLQGAWHADEAEDRRDDEDIVHREALLDDVAGEKLQPGLAAAHEPDPYAESHGDRDIAAVEDEAFLGLDLMVVPVQDAEVENEDAHDENGE